MFATISGSGEHNTSGGMPRNLLAQAFATSGSSSRNVQRNIITMIFFGSWHISMKLFGGGVMHLVAAVGGGGTFAARNPRSR